MAANGEEAPNPSPPSPPPPVQLPPYPEMILEAIDALDNKNGSSKTAISGYIQRKYGSSIPFFHVQHLTAHLFRMKTTGELYFSRNNYFRPGEEDPSEPAPADPLLLCDQDPEPVDSVSEVPDGVPDPDPVVADAVPAPAPVVAADAGAVPVKRGRGRPPKPKEPVDQEPDPASVAVPSVAADAGTVLVKRGRGRPPKPKQPVAEEPDVTPVAVPVVADDADEVPAPSPVVAADAVVVPAKRGRGRPPKPKDPTSEANADDAADAVPVKRGRGRPPKPKDPVAEAVAIANRGMPRNRGRPRKKAKVADEQAPIGSPAAATGSAADADSMPVKRGRGRPSKVRQ